MSLLNSLASPSSPTGRQYRDGNIVVPRRQRSTRWTSGKFLLTSRASSALPTIPVS